MFSQPPIFLRQFLSKPLFSPLLSVSSQLYPSSLCFSSLYFSTSSFNHFPFSPSLSHHFLPSRSLYPLRLLRSVPSIQFSSSSRRRRSPNNVTSSKKPARSSRMKRAGGARIKASSIVETQTISPPISLSKPKSLPTPSSSPPKTPSSQYTPTVSSSTSKSQNSQQKSQTNLGEDSTVFEGKLVIAFAVISSVLLFIMVMITSQNTVPSPYSFKKRRIYKHLHTVAAIYEPKLRDQMFQSISKQFKLTSDRSFERIFYKIIRQLPAEANDINWSIHVFQSDQLQAFSTLGGHIFVSEALLQLKEGELAFVIAHEVSHCFMRKTSQDEMMNHLMDRSSVLMLMYLYKHRNNPKNTFVQTMFRLSNAEMSTLSHIDEYEADYLGLLLIAECGYDPNMSVSTLQKLTEPKPRVNGRVYSHPNNEKRIRYLEEWIKQMEESGLSFSSLKREAKLQNQID